MNECQPIEPRLQVEINGMRAKSVRLRSHLSAPGDFDVVVEDPWLGVFALHRQFDLLAKEEGSEWRETTIKHLSSPHLASRTNSLGPARNWFGWERSSASMHVSNALQLSFIGLRFRTSGQEQPSSFHPC